MFIGPFGLALAANEVAPKPSLGALVLAAQRVDGDSLPATLVVAFGVFGAGVGLYAGATRRRDRWGSVLLASFVVTLGVVYCGVVFGPAPPSVRVLAMSGLLGWLFVVGAYWIDRHRVPVDSRSSRGAP